MSSSEGAILYTIIYKILKFWRGLINPKTPYVNVALQRKSRLLATGLVVMILVFSGVDITYSLTIPDYQVPWFGYGFMMGAFIMNRYQRYYWAARLTILMFPMVIFSSVYGGTAANPIYTLYYSVLSLLLGSIFLKKSGVIVLGLINTLGIIILPLFPVGSAYTFSVLIGPFSTSLIATALTIIYMQHRDQIEKDRQTLQALSDTRYQAIFQQSPLGITIISPTTQILEANSEFSQMTGYSNIELLTMNMIELTHPDDMEASAKIIRHALAEKIDIYNLEQRLITKTGEAVWINFIGNIFRDEAGNITFGVGLSEDVTAQKLAAQALKESIDKFQGFLEQSTDGISIVAPDGSISEWSPGMENLTGFTTQEVVGEKVWDVQFRLAPAERRTASLRTTFKELNTRFFETDAIDPQYQRMETDFVNTQGELKSMQVATFPIKTDKGILIGSIHRDITERKRAEENLRSIARDLSEAQRIAKLGSWRNDAASGEVVWSDQVYRIFGYESDTPSSPQEIFSQHIHPADKETYWQEISNHFQDPQTTAFRDIPFRIITPTRETKHLITSGEFDFSANNMKSGARGTILDVTEQKKAQEALQTLATELERSNQELEQFAYIASHDLQEPLRKIQAFGDRLQSRYGETLDDRGLNYLTRMQSAAERGQKMIEALLTYSRVATQGQPFAATDLNQVIAEVLSDLELLIERSQGRVTVEDLPTISADSTQIRQLFQNLIGNALKFHAPDQPPIVAVSCTVLTPEKVQIQVQDQGIGFDEAFADRIFQPFQRLHGRGEFEGSGIDLAVCRKIVERHGGEILAQSKPGEGAVFSINLPKAPVAIDG